MEIKKVANKGVLRKCNLEGFNFQVDPYFGCEHLCAYCYGLNRSRFDWEKQVLMYEDVVKELSRELDFFPPQTIYIGMNCDPYQPAEKEYEQTREILQLLSRKGFSACVLTKGAFVNRDIELLKKIPNASIGTSLAFLEEETRRLFEKNSPPNIERLEMLGEMKKAGIETYTLLCPVIPFFTDVPRLIEIAAPYSDTIWVYPVKFESKKVLNWKKVCKILGENFPDLIEEFTAIVFSENHYYWDDLREELEKIAKEIKANIRMEF